MSIRCFYLLLLSAILCTPVLAQQDFDAPGAVHSSKVEFLGKTPPIRERLNIPNTDPEKRKAHKANRPRIVENFRNQSALYEPLEFDQYTGADPVRQLGILKNNESQVEPIVNVDGIGFTNVAPPDPSLAVSEDFVMQAVNATTLQVFDKEGNPVSNTFSANTFWAGTGFASSGDPILLFDKEAKRWIITEFASPQDNTLLWAISETEDPLGSYFIYDFQTPNFPDYPKYGIWPEAYVVGTNELPSVPVYAVERQKMLAGEEDVTLVRVTANPINASFFPMLLPADWDGDTPPPATTKPMFLRVRDGNNSDAVQIYTFDINFDNPNSSGLTFQEVQLAPLNSDGCVFDGFFTCVPQPGNEPITGFPGLIMERIQYRNFETHETMVLSFMVNANTTADPIAGLRWVELRREAGQTDWALYQEGTFAPEDGEHRFLGSISMDADGNIGLAYTISSETTFPSLAFTGRRQGDPLGEMTIDELVFIEGTGVVEFGNRYGDYSTMRVDPADDQTFWITSEYGRAGTSWDTRIASFIIRRDSNDMAATALLAPISAEFLSDSETITANFTNAGFEPQQFFQVGYSVDGLPPVMENLDTIIQPLGNYEHSFLTTADFSAYGNHEVEVFVILDSDTNPVNDTLRQIVERIPRYDAGITQIFDLNTVDCKEAIPIRVKLTNFGLDTLTSVNINWQINNGIVNTQPWTGSLLTDQESNFINLVITGFVDGPNEITLFTSDPNGVPDQFTENDGQTRIVDNDLDAEFVSLFIKFDFFPEETSWELETEAGLVIAAGGPYEEAGSFQEVNETFCLDPAACYVFTINDAGGNGLILVPGTYSITDGDGNVLAGLLQVNFGSQEVNPFCATFECNVEAVANVLDESASGAGDGSIMITPTSGGGGFQYSLDGGMTFQTAPDFENLSAGNYTVLIEDVNGCQAELPVTVEGSVSTAEQLQAYGIEVFPNPTNELFRINISGMDGVDFLPIRILDASGKVVQFQRLQRYNDVLTAALSLRAYPSGMYFVQFQHEGLSKMVRVVKE